MLRVIYASESNLDAGTMLREVRDIHARSVENNGVAGVTGALLFSDMYFLQALEGEEAAVRATVARILGDDRHRKVAIIAEDTVSDRRFGPWTMKLVLRDTATDAVFRRFGFASVFSPDRLSAESALGLLAGLAQPSAG